MSSEILSMFSGELWAMDASKLSSFVSECRQAIDSYSAAGFPKKEDEEESLLSVRDGVATLPIKGTLVKTVPAWARFFGVNATSTQEARSLLTEAIDRADVDSIVLDIDSPGGSVSGIQELADDVSAARDLKPLSARVEGCVASAAYWIASQAQSISATRASSVGSIGVFSVVSDLSRMAEDAGVKVHVVTTSSLKGVGVVGAQVTGEQLSDIQRHVDSVGRLFFESVARGRNMEEEDLAMVCTGQVWLAQEARDMRLIDIVLDSRRIAKTRNVDEAVIASISEALNTMEDEMDEKTKAEFERLRMENEAMKAEKEKAELKADMEKVAKIDALLDHYASRIPTRSAERVADLVHALSVNEAEAYLKDLPLVGNTERQSLASEKKEEDEDEEQPYRPDPTAEKSIARIFGKSEAHVQDTQKMAMAVERVEHCAERQPNGETLMVPYAVLKGSGERVNRADLRKRLGLKAALLGSLIFLFSANAGAAALTTSRATECRWGGVTKLYLMTVSQTIYAGGMVMLDSGGRARAAAAVASNKNVVGVAQETKTSPASGSTYIRVSDGVLCKFAATTIAQTNVGGIVFSEDDQTIDDAEGSNEPVAGILLQYDSPSVGWVYISSLVNLGRVNVSQPITLTNVLTLSEGATIGQAANNKLTFTENSEDVSIVFSSNALALESATGVVALDFGAVGTTLTFASDQTLGTGTNNKFIWGENSEDWVWEFKNNEVEFSSTTGVTVIDFGTLDITAADLTASADITAGADVSVGGTLSVTGNTDLEGTFLILGSQNTIGWTAADGANTACSTTCAGTGSCVIGYDAGTSAFVACNSALADTCVCAGPAS